MSLVYVWLIVISERGIWNGSSANGYWGIGRRAVDIYVYSNLNPFMPEVRPLQKMEVNIYAMVFLTIYSEAPILVSPYIYAMILTHLRLRILKV